MVCGRGRPVGVGYAVAVVAVGSAKLYVITVGRAQGVAYGGVDGNLVVGSAPGVEPSVAADGGHAGEEQRVGGERKGLPLARERERRAGLQQSVARVVAHREVLVEAAVAVVCALKLARLGYAAVADVAVVGEVGVGELRRGAHLEAPGRRPAHVGRARGEAVAAAVFIRAAVYEVACEVSVERRRALARGRSACHCVGLYGELIRRFAVVTGRDGCPTALVYVVGRIDHHRLGPRQAELAAAPGQQVVNAHHVVKIVAYGEDGLARVVCRG